MFLAGFLITMHDEKIDQLFDFVQKVFEQPAGLEFFNFEDLKTTRTKLLVLVSVRGLDQEASDFWTRIRNLKMVSDEMTPFSIENSPSLDEVLAAILDIQELPDGYSFLINTDLVAENRIRAFAEKESLCCPSMNWEVSPETKSGRIWLSVSGGPTAKALCERYIPSIQKRD